MNAKILILGTGLFAMALVLTGCLGASSRGITLQPAYTPPPNPRFEVAYVTNDTGMQYDFDICSELKSEINLELARQHLDMASIPDAPKLILQTHILDYEKGNAFKRWLMPGYGGTHLQIQTRLATTSGEEVGMIYVDRSVEMGGVYSIGEWKEIVGAVAKDIVNELKEKMIHSQPAQKVATQ